MILSISEHWGPGKIFQEFAENQINIEFTTQVIKNSTSNNLVLCVDNKDTGSSFVLLEKIKPVIKASKIIDLTRVGIVSIFPHKEHALISSTIIQALTCARIPLLALGSSISTISCIVDEKQMTDAVKHISKSFGL